MIEKCAVLMSCELVRKPRPGRNRPLRQVRHAVHRIGDFKAVPVRGERLEALAIDPLPRRNFSFDWLGDKLEHLRAIVDRERQVFHVRRNHL